jgi:aminopeptidase N
MVQPIFERLGVRNINNEPYFDRLARNIAMKWACYMGSEECLKLTSDRIKNYITTNIDFEADVRSTVFCNGMRQADEEVFMGLWNKMQSSTIQADRNLMITSLGCSQDPELLKVLLGTSIAETGVNYSNAERANILTAVIQGGVVGVDAVMEFLDVNFAKASQM